MKYLSGTFVNQSRVQRDIYKALLKAITEKQDVIEAIEPIVDEWEAAEDEAQRLYQIRKEEEEDGV